MSKRCTIPSLNQVKSRPRMSQKAKRTRADTIWNGLLNRGLIPGLIDNNNFISSCTSQQFIHIPNDMLLFSVYTTKAEKVSSCYRKFLIRKMNKQNSVFLNSVRKTEQSLFSRKSISQYDYFYKTTLLGAGLGRITQNRFSEGKLSLIACHIGQFS